MFSDVNWVAIAVAAVAYWVSGALWYSPLILGNKFMSLMGLSKKDMEKMQKAGMAKEYILSFIAAVVVTFVLSYFLQMAGSASVREAATLVFWIWLGFMAPISLSGVLWEKRKAGLYFIGTSWNLVALLIAASILVSWA